MPQLTHELIQSIYETNSIPDNLAFDRIADKYAQQLIEDCHALCPVTRGDKLIPWHLAHFNVPETKLGIFIKALEIICQQTSELYLYYLDSLFTNLIKAIILRIPQRTLNSLIIFEGEEYLTYHFPSLKLSPPPLLTRSTSGSLSSNASTVKSSPSASPSPMESSSPMDMDFDETLDQKTKFIYQIADDKFRRELWRKEVYDVTEEVSDYYAQLLLGKVLIPSLKIPQKNPHLEAKGTVAKIKLKYNPFKKRELKPHFGPRDSAMDVDKIIFDPIKIQDGTRLPQTSKVYTKALLEKCKRKEWPIRNFQEINGRIKILEKALKNEKKRKISPSGSPTFFNARTNPLNEHLMSSIFRPISRTPREDLTTSSLINDLMNDDTPFPSQHDLMTDNLSPSSSDSTLSLFSIMSSPPEEEIMRDVSDEDTIKLISRPFS